MSERNNKLELLGSAPIPKALMALGVPIMIGMLINALYNLVDAYFVSGLGKSQMGAIYESNELLDVVESFLHNTVTPCPQLCGRHTGGLHHPLSFAIWQRNAAALLIIVKL